MGRPKTKESAVFGCPQFQKSSDMEKIIIKTKKQIIKFFFSFFNI